MTQPVLDFKSNLPLLTLLQLHSQDIETIKATLKDKFKQAPMMFIGMQLIIDFSDFDQSELSLSFKELNHFLSGEGLKLVAIMSNKKTHRQAAVEQGIGAIPTVATAIKRQQKPVVQPVADTPPTVAVDKQPATAKPVVSVSEEPRKLTETEEVFETQLENQLINHSVRSGQCIYSRGDLTVVGAVGAGAEVIANGNIHIYGALRGRAIAGAQGDESARIFCHKLEAELVSIAGNYKPNEEFEDKYRHKNVQISLEGEKICFLTL